MLKKDYATLLKDFIIFTDRKSLVDVAERIAYRTVIAKTKEERRAAKDTTETFISLLAECRPEDLNITDIIGGELS